MTYANGPTAQPETQGLYAGIAGITTKRSDVPKQSSLREQLLQQGMELTSGDRDAEYGDPMLTFACATQLKEVFHAFQKRSGRFLCQAEREAIDMVLTKLSRLACGPKAKPDTYVDGATYFAIAGEAFLKNQLGELPPMPAVVYETTSAAPAKSPGDNSF